LRRSLVPYSLLKYCNDEGFYYSRNWRAIGCWCNQVSITVQEDVRSVVKDIIIFLRNVYEKRRMFISLLPSYFVPESLSFCSVLEGQVNCGTCTLDFKGILHWNVSDI
jgi:hypothetical protein